MSTNDLFSMTGKTVLITGASSGLGYHFALTLAAAGATVVAAARRKDRLENLVKEIEGAGGKAVAVSMDVSDEKSIVSGFDAAEAEVGTIDVLMNNAGIVSRGTSLELSMDDWDRVMNTNLKAVLRVSQEAVNRLIVVDKPGSIINTASILSFRLTSGNLPYAVSKAAVVQMTRALALEWARYSIRVNAIAPGYIETDLNRDLLRSDRGQELIKRIPQRRTGELEELSGPLLLLASDASSFMTGETIVVDGGHLVNSV
jgi:NAD(P)-dependent dehydrogenase (short-subunit alcohol dehydrogenase family)